MNPPSSSHPHIFTLTGNLLAERTLDFAAWSPGRTQRARRESFQVGGKGINVAKMLTRLGVANTALCFTGGAPGIECEAWLLLHKFDFRAFVTHTPTRVGIVVRDESASLGETTFLGPDAAPDAGAIQACADFLIAQAPGQILALCGSFPGWTEPHFAPLRYALDRWLDQGSLIVDAYGPPLADLVAMPLALLKINADELRSLGPAGLEGIPFAVQNVIITDGPRPLHVRDRAGNTRSFDPMPVKEVSPTGSGDVFLACVIEALYVRKLSLPAAIAFALPQAAANAAHPGIADFPFPAGGAGRT